MTSLYKIIYENDNYQVVVIPMYNESAKSKVNCYGLLNKKTDVIEHYSSSLHQAMTQAEVDNAVIVNEWWKKQAAKEISLLHGMYKTGLNS